MFCRMMDLRCKEVVNVNDGKCLGCVSDLELDTCSAQVTALIIYGKPRFFGIFGRGDDLIIGWSCIECIGDAVLIKYTYPPQSCGTFRRKNSILDRLLG